MAARGINYYVDYLAIDPLSFKIYYDFNDSGAYVQSVPSGDPAYSGTISTIGDFWSQSGSGHFTGQYVQINWTSGLNSGDWTFFFVYEKEQTGKCTLFSNYKTGMIGSYSGYMGFAIGINDANRLFFESYDSNGVYVKTFDTILSNKNAVAISKSQGLLSFSYYNFTTKNIESQDFYISNQYLFDSDEWYLGAAINAPAYYDIPPFMGYMDEFLYFNQALNPTNTRILFSGFYSEKTGVVQQVTANTLIDITGYASGMIQSGSGITGFSVTGIGSIFDACGNEFKLYQAQDLSGIATTSGLIPLTGEITYYITGETEGGIYVDYNFITGFGMNEITYIRAIDIDDVSSAIVYANSEDIINFFSKFDIVKSQFTLNDQYTYEQLNVYLNGIAQFGSGYGITGGLYNSGIQLSGDFYVDEDKLQATGFYDNTDFIIYDLFSGTKIRHTGFHHGSGAADAIFDNYDGALWFFNGVKLNSGSQFDATSGEADYYLSGSSIIFPSGNILSSGSTGSLFCLSIATGFVEQTGRFTTFSTTTFPRGTSMTWLNGQRMVVWNDYVESCSLDLISGSGIFENTTGLLYNNSNDFWS